MQRKEPGILLQTHRSLSQVNGVLVLVRLLAQGSNTKDIKERSGPQS